LSYTAVIHRFGLGSGAEPGLEGASDRPTHRWGHQ